MLSFHRWLCVILDGQSQPRPLSPRGETCSHPSDMGESPGLQSVRGPLSAVQVVSGAG
jgi:hypothetical protein